MLSLDRGRDLLESCLQRATSFLVADTVNAKAYPAGLQLPYHLDAPFAAESDTGIVHRGIDDSGSLIALRADNGESDGTDIDDRAVLLRPKRCADLGHDCTDTVTLTALGRHGIA